MTITNSFNQWSNNYSHPGQDLNPPEPNSKSNKLDKFIGCCGGGLQRHEICSHVKKYYATLLQQTALEELERYMEEASPDLIDYEYAVPRLTTLNQELKGVE